MEQVNDIPSATIKSTLSPLFRIPRTVILDPLLRLIWYLILLGIEDVEGAIEVPVLGWEYSLDVEGVERNELGVVLELERGVGGSVVGAGS